MCRIVKAKKIEPSEYFDNTFYYSSMYYEL